LPIANSQTFSSLATRSKRIKMLHRRPGTSSRDRLERRIAHAALLAPRFFKLLGSSPQCDLVGDVYHLGLAPNRPWGSG
jgi:hypothetical protein